LKERERGFCFSGFLIMKKGESGVHKRKRREDKERTQKEDVCV